MDVQARFFDRIEPSQIIAPFADGVWQVSGREARYWPRAAWAAGVTYQWSLAAGFAAIDGTPLPARYDSRFTTTAIATPSSGTPRCAR